MIILLLQTLIHLAIILPLIIVLAEKNKESCFRIIVFCLCVMLYVVIIMLPFFYRPLLLIKGRMNWNGKILSIIFWIIGYFILKKLFVNNNFFTIKQEKHNLKKIIFVVIAIIVFDIIYALPQDGIEFNINGLLFVLLMPGLDEEIFFRGILLGLLLSSLKVKKIFFIDTGVLILAILFGLVHALRIYPDYSLNFSLKYFIYAGTLGYILGWITIKSKSILIPIIVHNLSDFFLDLIVMIK